MTLDAQVQTLMRAVARDEIVPRFRTLGAGDVREKQAGEVVTAADVAAERALADGLRAILPDAAFVGEEVVADDPSVLDRLAEPAPVWVVDPIDGTAHFARGEQPFGVMLALVVDGRAERAWIYLPEPGTMATARRGHGAFVDGVRVQAGSPAARPPRGVVHMRFAPEALQAAVERERHTLELLPTQRCAAVRYARLATGAEDFTLFWRTEPWDHVAGCLLIEEAGGRARRPDGRAYQVRDDREGLLVASSAQTWDTLRAQLFG